MTEYLVLIIAMLCNFIGIYVISYSDASQGSSGSFARLERHGSSEDELMKSINQI